MNPIDKLDEMLNKAGIPHIKNQKTWKDILTHSTMTDEEIKEFIEIHQRLCGPEKGLFERNQICYPDTYQNENCRFDCIWHTNSYGEGEEVETYGELGNVDGEPDVMTIDKAFEIIKNDWEKEKNK